jgi:IS5 family transposase
VATTWTTHVFHLRIKARRLWPHQTRAQASLHDRGRHRQGHLGRCFRKGRAGDVAKAILTAVGYNLRLVLAWLRIIFRAMPFAMFQSFASRWSSNRVFNGRLFWRSAVDAMRFG